MHHVLTGATADFQYAFAITASTLKYIKNDALIPLTGI
jgi:hypothetical protein